jgi:acetyl-CoA acetyltransferase
MKSIVYGAMSIALGNTNTAVTGGFESMSNAPFLIMNVIFRNKNSPEKDWDSEIKNYTTLSATMVFKMLITKSQWETVHKKLPMILRLPDKCKINTVNSHTKGTLKL